MSAESNPTPVRLDTRGLFCPMPIIKLAELVKTLKPGARVEILSDDLGIQEDLPAWCKSHGHSLVGLGEDQRGDFVGTVDVGEAHRAIG